MNYPVILFDADDTLFDFTASQLHSFRKTLEHFKIEDRFTEIFQTYSEISIELWKRIEKGEISKEFLKVHRFHQTFEIHKIDHDPQAASDMYLNFLPENVHLIPGSIEVCKTLSQRSRLGIVTNGIAPVQKRRLANSDLRNWIEFMVISDECGFAKPDKRIFEYALEKAGHSDFSTVVMVGDRLEADILGANRMGIKSCWFNPHKLENTTDIVPNFEVHSLEQLLDII